ncbi:MAG: molybdopterin dinucleotide binding domain-containing protein, partial [Tumebacillaceae bacterium]
VFQWGGAWLCEGGVCPTADGRGKLLPIELPELRKPEGHFYVTTRRGKQFNSMVYSDTDPFNAADRFDVLLNAQDAQELNIRDGEAIVVYNQFGMFHGRAHYEEIRSGNIGVYWPEGNVLLPKGVYEQYAGIPEYNTAVIVEKADTYHAQKDTRYVERRIEELETSVG